MEEKAFLQKTQVEGLDQLGVITVVAREDGSGTRNVLAEVETDKSAIGYVSMGALKEATGIKVLAVNDTELDTETVKKEPIHCLVHSIWLIIIRTRN